MKKNYKKYKTKQIIKKGSLVVLDKKNKRYVKSIGLDEKGRIIGIVKKSSRNGEFILK